MILPRKLRVRVALAFALLGGTISLLLALALYLTAQDLGQGLTDETLRAEMEDYIARRQRNPLSLPPATITLLGFVQPANPSDPAVPEAIERLTEGHHDIIWQDLPYRVLIRQQEEQRFFLLYNQTLHWRRESRFILFLAAGVVAMVVLASSGGWILAGRVIAPVVELAQRVGSMGLEDSEPLSPHFSQDELGALAQVFDQHHGQLQAFIQRERFFTADVSHELRTPLAVIQGALEIVLDDPQLTTRNKQRLHRAERAVREMTTLTQALLLLSREEKLHAPADHQCRVAQVVTHVVEQNRYLLGSKPVEVVLDLDHHLHLPVACVFLTIVVGNLMRNAFSYTQQGQVTIRLDQESLLVTDSGSGIQAEELGLIFQRHYKGASSQGAGIGLSLVKRICQHCHWQVTMDSQPSQGTRAHLFFSQKELS